MRTACASAVAADLLAPRNTPVLAILGSGVQAYSHLQALKHVREFQEVRVWSRTAAQAEKFASENGAKSTSAEAAVRGADIVVVATGAQTPLLKGAWLKDGALVTAVGAVGPTARELDDDVMTNVVVVECREAASKEAADIFLSGAVIDAEIGELLNGKRLARKTRNTVYKSVGIAVEDLASARLVYEALRSRE
jgi:thiomorpholine-carboxylate dehydrogenase